VPLVLVLSLVACGGHEQSTQAKSNVALLDRVAVYPGVTAAKTTPGEAFAARDWRLPAGARAAQVIDWYVARLQARGWKVTGKSFDTIRATKGPSSLSVGVRGRTLEVVGVA
jgi:hypothetical protein